MPAAPAPRRFRFAPGLTALAIVGAVLFASLGLWQLDRAGEKRERLAGFTAGGARTLQLPAGFEAVPRYQQLAASGRYDASRQVLLDNMTWEGQAGYRVLTPLVLADGRAVIVDRGFVAGTGDRGRLPDIRVPEEPRTVEGRADYLPRPGLELAAPAGSGWPRVMSFPYIEDLERALALELFPQVLLLDPEAPDGYVRDWQPPGIGPERHIGYAVQWFGLAVTVAVIWALLSFRGEETGS